MGPYDGALLSEPTTDRAEADLVVDSRSDRMLGRTTWSGVVRHRQSGDTLPLLTKQIYGSPAAYLDVARFNGLDDFRTLTPGKEILFPPLVTFGRGAPGRK